MPVAIATTAHFLKNKENRFGHQNRVVALPSHQSFCQNCLLKDSGDKYCLYRVHSGLAIWFMAASPPLNILRLLFFPGEVCFKLALNRGRVDGR